MSNMSKKKLKKLKKKLKKYEDKEKKKPKLNIHPETKRGVAVVILITLAVIFILSFQGIGGFLGEYLLKGSRFVFGSCLWLIPLAFIAAGIAILKEIHRNVYLSTLLGMFLFILSFLALVQIIFPNGEQYRAGWFGYLISWPFLKIFGFWVSLVVFGAALLISVLVAFNIPLRKLPKEELEEEGVPTEKMSKEIKGLPSHEKRVARFVKGILGRPGSETKELEEKEKTGKEEELLTISGPGIKDYTFPPLELLEADKGYPASGDIKTNMSIIEKTLENFGIPVEMGEVNVGPTVTQYTLRPAGGVKLSKITTLHRDISLALAAHPIRIEAPIPGRSLVGIEIPNKTKTLVRLRDLLSGYDYKKDGHYINMVLGRDVAGNPVWANLVKMPHLLIAGATGSGKSICIHSLIISLLYQKSPWELKFILIDPKRVELPFYNGIPHLLTPVIVELNKVLNAFKWAIKEMEERYKKLADVGAKDLASYNEKIAKVSPQNILPYIIIIVDELADIMAAYGKEVEWAIVRLAQMSRAVGLHLVVSTQRPSVEIITGLIKANITSRIALQVASQVDSRTILDMMGAERLLGNGDMLFLAGDVGKPKRIQGVYMSEKEIRNVVKFLRKEAGEIEYEEIIPEPEEQRSFEGQTLAWDDPLLEEVKQLVIQTNKASASYLQRRFRIGYARAASLLDMLEQEGLIGPADGAKPREVLVKRKGEEEELGELDETVKENVEKDTDDLDEIPTPPVEEDEENEEETEEKDEF
ncbi:MAG: cell division protein FtsK [Candidatus Portnoybacteria bacterium CG10_big_fil_rev_8_21_14_0_10_38_18]|uniref:Cell division protein FtsK n=1 Tax=Candidatus Portnoybacteria bacterium CG10_big_fil_rev_8_21_14_0_10_38_18 TaxID=1974813 RepID=A0A2M8KCZ0_9BACT|nr:MAG: cell division protein FtsK [Candidatus Portnoybacteria bacterium CG10_big_fil_rev_8_21_14_0_10_38_18]